MFESTQGTLPEGSGPGEQLRCAAEASVASALSAARSSGVGGMVGTDARKGAVMWHSGRASGAAGPGDGAGGRGEWWGEEPERSRVTTRRARHWRRDEEEEERQIKANLPPTPPGVPPPAESDLASCGRLWGTDLSNPC